MSQIVEYLIILVLNSYKVVKVEYLKNEVIYEDIIVFIVCSQ